MADIIYVRTTQAGKDTYIKLDRDLVLKDHPEYQRELGGRREADSWYKPSWLSSNSYPCYHLESFYTRDKDVYIYDEEGKIYYLTCRSIVPDICIKKVTTHYLLPCFHVNIIEMLLPSIQIYSYVKSKWSHKHFDNNTIPIKNLIDYWTYRELAIKYFNRVYYPNSLAIVNFRNTSDFRIKLKIDRKVPFPYYNISYYEIENDITIGFDLPCAMIKSNCTINNATTAIIYDNYKVNCNYIKTVCLRYSYSHELKCDNLITWFDYTTVSGPVEANVIYLSNTSSAPNAGNAKIIKYDHEDIFKSSQLIMNKNEYLVDEVTYKECYPGNVVRVDTIDIVNRDGRYVGIFREGANYMFDRGGELGDLTVL